MKIIHTADWHLGQLFYGYERNDEHRHMARCLIDAVDTHRPDALIVAGDIFNTPNPSIAALGIYNETMMRLHQTAPGMKIIVLAGNHDSASRLEVTSQLWRHFNLEIVTGLTPEGRIIELPGKGYIAAIPYIYEGNYPEAGDCCPTDERIRLFHQKILDDIAAMNSERLPVVMTAHIAVSDKTSATPSDRYLSYHPLAAMGNGYDYLAMGHIHKSITMASGNAIARYSGSPLSVSFDEEPTHSFTLVNIGRHGDMPETELLEIPVIRPLETFPEDIPVGFDETIELLEKNLPSYHDCYLRVMVKCDDGIAGNAKIRLAEALSGKRARFCLLTPVSTTAGTGESFRRITREEISVKEPSDLAAEYYAARFGCEMPQEYFDIIDDITRAVDAGQEQ